MPADEQTGLARDHVDRDHANSDRLNDITERLRSISEDLTEFGIDVLREAVDNGATSRPPIEKPLAAARRSVEKAINLLDRATR